LPELALSAASLSPSGPTARVSFFVEKATTTLLFGQNLQMHVRLRV